MHNDPPPESAAIYPALVWLMLARQAGHFPWPPSGDFVESLWQHMLPDQLGRGETSTNLAACWTALYVETPTWGAANA